MLTVGLTGSTGSGKGYISAIFEKNGIPCLDTDAVCRIVYSRGQDCYRDLVEYFGDAILDDKGEIDRKALFNTAFQDKDKYEKLNSIAFCHIMKYTKNWLEEQSAEGAAVAVVDAPMLFESGFDKLCGKVVSVIADRQTQIERVMCRDSISAEVAEQRLEKQKSNQYYTSRSDYVIDNSVSNGDGVKADTERLIKALRNLSAETEC